MFFPSKNKNPTQAAHIYSQRYWCKDSRTSTISSLTNHSLPYSNTHSLHLSSSSVSGGFFRRLNMAKQWMTSHYQPSSCRCPLAPTATSYAARTHPKSSPESRRNIRPTSIRLRCRRHYLRRRRNPSPVLSSMNASLPLDSITFRNSNLAPSMPTLGKNPLHGFSR